MWPLESKAQAKYFPTETEIAVEIPDATTGVETVAFPVLPLPSPSAK
jgi:hypothetical protein